MLGGMVTDLGAQVTENLRITAPRNKKPNTMSKQYHRIISVYFFSLITFAILLTSSFQPSDGAALNHVGKTRQFNRDRGKFLKLLPHSLRRFIDKECSNKSFIFSNKCR